MIASIVGKTFLDAYNEKYQTDYSPKDFFVEVYWPLFYNHGKYMQWVINSPFVKGKKPDLISVEERNERLTKFHSKVAEYAPDASFAIGHPASEEKEYASTSGLVSDLLIPTDSDEVYLSWLGSGLGITVAGGFTILFNDPHITLQTFEGWRVYRDFLKQTSLERLRGNQVNTWNGQWLTYSMNEDEFREDFDFSELHAEGIFKADSSLVEVNTVAWSRLYFSLSSHMKGRELMAYVYSLGQTNKTIGFIPFQFQSARTLLDVYNALAAKKIFGENKIGKKDFESLFGLYIKRACELGSIGLQALRPASLVKYMTNHKKPSLKKEEDIIHYQVYKTWLVAMLSKNKEELLDYTSKLAKAILAYRAGGKGTERKNLIEKELFPASGKKAFIGALTKMLKEVEVTDSQDIKTLRDEVHLMTNEEYGYFNTLLKFDYTFEEKNS